MLIAELPDLRFYKHCYPILHSVEALPLMVGICGNVFCREGINP
ncbi:MAG: hypothetical protein ACTSV5_02070 [Promethearchaeota archaeon]